MTPLVNITMLVKDRPRLTRQAIESLYANTPKEMFNLQVYDDGSQDETQHLIGKLGEEYGFYFETPWNQPSLGTGKARNHVINKARSHSCGHGDLLYLSDNDIFAKPGWLETLVECYQHAKSLGYVALGAYAHPYSQPFRSIPFYTTTRRRIVATSKEILHHEPPVTRRNIIGQLHALPLQSWLWSWEDWDRFGPFVETPVGVVCGSEDVEMCQRITKAGGKVGAVYPPLIVNTGRTNSFGNPIPGAELIPDVEGVIVE